MTTETPRQRIYSSRKIVSKLIITRGTYSSMPLRHHLQSYYRYMPKTRRYLPWHQFFEEGDIQCSSRSKQVEFQEHDFTKTRRHFACHIRGCNDSFTSLPEFEMHYNSAHWNVCSHCKQWFPSNHLLDIHVQESHDSFFEVMKLKEKMCLVESCDCKFMNEEDRQIHLIQVHHYPPDFQFGKPTTNENLYPSSTGGIVKIQSDKTAVIQEKHQRNFPKEICFGQGSAKSFHLMEQPDD